VIAMLVTPGDLIPVEEGASKIPWTRRKSQILNYLHRGPVTFSTLVYDTNVGDISSISAYFNQERISVSDLNNRFGQYPTSGELRKDNDNIRVGSEPVVKPRLLLYPAHNLNTSQSKSHRAMECDSDASSEHSRSPATSPRSGNDWGMQISPRSRDSRSSSFSENINQTRADSGFNGWPGSQAHRARKLGPIGQPPAPAREKTTLNSSYVGRGILEPSFAYNDNGWKDPSREGEVDTWSVWKPHPW